jgi:flagellar motor switch protein FliN/FliY
MTELSRDDALVRIGASTAEAVAQVLEALVPGTVTRGDVTVHSGNGSPFGTIEADSVLAGVSYVGGGSGANIFIAPPASARALASHMGAPAPESEDEPLSELELSAVSEAAQQMMASSAAAVGVVIGEEVEISPPRTQTVTDAAAADELYGSSPYATTTGFSIAGAPCRLVQLIPSAFVTKISNALEKLADAAPSLGRADAPGDPPVGISVQEALAGVGLRVWAELGRTRLPLGDTLGLPLGAVVELDRATEEPVDLYVNGLRFAHGQLLVGDDGNWAIKIDELEPRPGTGPHPPHPSELTATTRSSH